MIKKFRIYYPPFISKLVKKLFSIIKINAKEDRIDITIHKESSKCPFYWDNGTNLCKIGRYIGTHYCCKDDIFCGCSMYSCQEKAKILSATKGNEEVLINCNLLKYTFTLDNIEEMLEL